MYLGVAATLGALVSSAGGTALSVVDTAAPDTLIDSMPPDPSNRTTATFSFRATTYPVSHFECTLGAAPYISCSSPFTTPPLEEGVHTFYVRAVDMAGNEDPSPATRVWRVDVTPPDTTITSQPPSSTTSTSATFSFTSSETGASFECKLGAGSFSPCPSPITYSLLPAGSYTFQVRAKDMAANVDPSPASYTWTIDRTAPDTTLTAQPPNPSNSTSAMFAFTSNEATASFECKLDPAVSFTTCTSPLILDNLAVGSHTFQVRARDPAGNVDPTPASYTWFVDTAPPDTFITSGPPNSPDATITFTSNEAPVTFECRLDTTHFAPCTSPARLSNLPDGSHTFQVRARDSAGNMDPTPATLSWTVDTTAPDITITRYPPNPSNSTSATFIFSSSDPTAIFECKLDAEAFTPCTSPKTYVDLGNGSHTFQVRARDASGNVDASPASYSWAVDTVAPDTFITSPPPNSPDATITFTSNEAPVTFECRLDSEAFTGCTSPVTLPAMTDGSHTFHVYAIDAAWNVDPTPATLSWTVDTTAPDITITRYPPNPSRSSSATFSFSSTEAGVAFECKLDTAEFVPCTSPSEYTGLTEGPHTFQVRATDAAGNTTMPASFTWAVDTHAPEAPIIQSPSQGATITQRQPTISGTAQPGSTVALMLDDAPLGTTTASSLGQWTLTPTSQLSEGPHTLIATSQDEASNSATSAPVSFTIDAGGPPDGGDDDPDGGGGCGCGAGSTGASLLLWGLGLLATLGARRRARPPFNHP